ncbi:MAG: pyridoxamine 5'-phosphate oxidase family protein [Ectothiorhodospiraceae bacterium]|nr:pyridoxamine 5'-phosphate oxidase family protein [Ectothiorhodospiraceae bacterium]MCH8502999.1 pyridoxamine 5'-phosphate oxidase family protein [Ectothiorhodospiraceae bacterium]
MIESVTALRQLYKAPSERALRKQLDHLDRHCRRFIELSPFVVLASGNSQSLDASPRGGQPGFVRIIDDHTLWIPDSPGNNRLDSLSNILETGKVGLLFMVPGVDETLRVNGRAHLTADADKTMQFADEKRTPRSIIVVTVQEAYLHCAKALMRSGLWSGEYRQERSVLPSMGEMLKDQTGSAAPPESQQEMLARYQQDL